ncbi:TPA: hypothetical protein ACQ7GR_003108 [Klebsiella pneumoniae]
MTSKLTRERIELIANFHRAMTLPPSHAEIEELARMALAAMDSEPVAVTDDELNAALQLHRLKVDGHSQLSDAFRAGFRYARRTTPQPAPVVPAVSDDIGEIRVGRLPTMNQDDYPGLGDWWVQLRIGEDSDEVLARVYGATPQEANNRAEALACRAAMLQAEPVCTCPSGDGSLRWPCPVHPGNSPVIPYGYVMVPINMTTEQMRAVQRDSTLGTFASAHLKGAFDLYREFWSVAVAASPQEVRKSNVVDTYQGADGNEHEIIYLSSSQKEVK